MSTAQAATPAPIATLTVEGDIGIVTINSPPVNALSQAVREGILTKTREANGNPAIKAIVLICDGRTFIAGADITEFGKPARGPALSEVQNENGKRAQAGDRRDSRHVAGRRPSALSSM